MTDYMPQDESIWQQNSPSTGEILWKNRITAILVALNIVIFIILEILGDTEDSFFMMKYGAIYPEYIYADKEYWRLLTATFMHFGFLHLFNNMVILIAAGQILEKALGHIKYLLLYLIAGLGGSTLSYLQMIHSGDYAVAAGASGAIFGIIGALLWIVIRNIGQYESLTSRGLIAMIVLCLYYGISSGNVDNWGHIGGLLGGFVMGIVFYRRNHQKY